MPAFAQPNSPALPDLPLANAFAALETMHPEIVSDRFNSGGLNVAEPSRLSGFLTSWSQTRYRLGGIDISSAVDGTPLIFPSLAWFSGITVDAVLMPIETSAPGLGVRFALPEPASSWSGVVEGLASGGVLTGSGPRLPPPIAALQRLTRGSGLVSGPLSGRARFSAGAEWADAAIDTANRATRDQRLASLFTNLAMTSSAHRDFRALAIVQRASGANAAHVQTSFERRPPDSVRWRVEGGYTYGRHEAAPPPADRVVIDRLIYGPIPLLAADRPRSERQWSVRASVSSPLAKRHAFDLNAEISHAGVHESRTGDRVIGETLDGQPARLWLYAPSARGSVRRTRGVTALGSDSIRISPRVQLDTAVRFDHASGHAEGAASGISWTSVSPSVLARWALETRLDLRLLVGARRIPHRLLLDLLTVGDPGSPVATVHRWESLSAGPGTLIARVGPGVRTDANFSVIDAQLPRPVTDEFIIGVESRPSRELRVAMTGLLRRQSRTPQLINVGMATSAYRTFSIPDANADLIKPDDDQLLTVYERLPVSFGEDRYRLTTAALGSAHMGAFVISVAASTSLVTLSAGATAAASVGAGGSRGFRAVENDTDLLGEVLTNPNAATNARGRLFNDRAYTIKTSMVLRLPAGIRAGVIARYQDGQPFTRLAIVPGLNQGPEAVQAFARGRSRFAFTGTLDLRLQKQIRLGRTRLDALVDIYNVPNMRKETEEYVVTGPRFRQPLAVQPPRSVQTGFRLTF